MSVAVREAVRAANEVHKKASSLLSCSCVPAYVWGLSHVQSCVCSYEGEAVGAVSEVQKKASPSRAVHSSLHTQNSGRACFVFCLCLLDASFAAVQAFALIVWPIFAFQPSAAHTTP